MWTRSRVIPDSFTVSSETSDIYKSAERLLIMLLLDLNKVVWQRFKEQKRQKFYWKVVQLQGMIFDVLQSSKISVHFSQSEFNILPVTIFKKD